MRCQLLVIFLLSIIFVNLQAQTYIGFKAGISESSTRLMFNIVPAEIEKRGNFQDLSLGIPVEIKINKIWSFQPEFLYATEGARISAKQPEERRVYTNTIRYFKLPLMVKMLFITKGQYRATALVGIIPAFASSIKSFSFSEDSKTSREEAIYFQTANISRFDLALGTGASLEKTIAKDRKVVLEAKYNIGVYDIDQTMERTIFTKNLYLNIGLLMPLKRKD